MRIGDLFRLSWKDKGQASYEPDCYRVVRLLQRESKDETGEPIVVERVELERIVVPGTET